MKIIERGMLPMDKLYTVTCQLCKAKFEFALHEAVIASEQSGFCKINCPLCGYQILQQIDSS